MSFFGAVFALYCLLSVALLMLAYSVDWLVCKLRSIPSDKWIHYAVCLTLTKMLCMSLPRWMVAVIMVAISLGKEIYDKVTGKGEADWKDFVADLMGIAFGLI